MVVAVLMVAGIYFGSSLGSNQNKSPAQQPSATASATPQPSGTPEPSATPGPSATPTAPPIVRKYAAAPPMTINPDHKYTATIATDQGDIVVELYPKDAPKTVNNFVFLARQHFYDGLTFHRVLPGFMAQGGDPNGDGTGGPGYTIPDEPNQHKMAACVISMAKTQQPNSAGSQFFITFPNATNLSYLDAQGFTVFGKVVSGCDVLTRFRERVPEQGIGLDKPGDTINSITIQEQP